MDNNQFLKALLKQQVLKDGDSEVKDLLENGNAIKKQLEDSFESDKPKVDFVGSYKKGTMVRDKYDLDIVCYFSSGDNEAGSNIQELFESVKKVLNGDYTITPKNSAIGVYASDDAGKYLHIDVVPGKFVDNDSGDVFLHVSSLEKDMLKTNLNKQIEHVKDSGFLDEVRLMKIWNVRHDSTVKTFVLELLVIKALESIDLSGKSLSERMESLFQYLLDHVDNMGIEDPANPKGNDLSKHFDAAVKQNLKIRLQSSLTLLEEGTWEDVYGKLPEADEKSLKAEARNFRTKSWLDGK